MNAALEYNAKGCMLFSLDCPGAFARGETREAAAAKLPGEVAAFCRWAGWTAPTGPVHITQEKFQPELRVEDGDSDILLDGERLPMEGEEYRALRLLVVRSARDFDTLYASIPDPDYPLAPPRETFYGAYPNTARKMFDHTNRVTSYYVGELGVEMDDLPGCLENRLLGLEKLEALPGFLTQPPRVGSYGEAWSLRKALRRFLWHDRLHARAMYRRAEAVWGDRISNPFGF